MENNNNKKNQTPVNKETHKVWFRTCLCMLFHQFYYYWYYESYDSGDKWSFKRNLNHVENLLRRISW